MKINYFSDIHLEFGPLKTEPQGGDVLVLAGDITTRSNTDWINDVAKKYKDVVFVFGNHEYYGSNLDSVERKMREGCGKSGNIHILQNESVSIGGVVFHGTTLWSDFNKGDPLTQLKCLTGINDYRLIRADGGSSRFNPQRANIEHNIAVKYLRDNVKPGDVVVTHMAPSLFSIHRKFRHDHHINGAYVSDLDDLINVLEPRFWFHGHTHYSFDYTIGKTRVLCNPRGYNGYEENPDFDINAMVSTLVLE